MGLTALTAVTIGIHLGSQHYPARDTQNNTNTGIYLRADDITIGGYRNTIRRNTFYIAKSVKLGYGFEVMGGLMTGYQTKADADGNLHGWTKGAIGAMVGATYKLPIDVMGVAPRLWLVPPGPKSSTVLHLSIEHTF